MSGQAPLLKASMRHFHRRYAMTLIGLLCLSSIFLTEASLRYYYQNAHRKMVIRYQNRELCTMRATDARLIYTYVPNTCEANTKGYNDAEYDYEKDPAIYRIVIIGDSVAAGLSSTENFGKLLEQRLNTKASPHRGKAYEVIVLARSGYSTSQELVILEDEAFQYHPDLVLWSYVLNDPAHPVYHNANGELGRFWYTPQYYALHFLQKAMFLGYERVKGYKCEKEFHTFLHCVYHTQIEENIRKIGTTAVTRHIPIIFLIHPIFEKGKTYVEYSLLPVHRMLHAMATSAGIMVWDLYDVFRDYHPEELKVTSNSQWYDPWHLNLKGHIVVAEYLYEKLTQGLWGKKPPQPSQ
jgi:hypothetical protein